jgi:hypothetical protein
MAFFFVSMLHVLYSFTTSSAYLRNILATIKQYTIEEKLNASKKKKDIVHS